jgi:hypothetical protein
MLSPGSPEKSDDVLIVLDIWDVPLSGVTMFEGAFHSFQRVFDEEAQSWSQSHDFLLQRLTGAELNQFNELNTLYQAWLAAYKDGKVSQHPLIPEATGPGVERYRELHRLTAEVLHADTERTVRCTGKIAQDPNSKIYAAQWQRASS